MEDGMNDTATATYDAPAAPKRKGWPKGKSRKTAAVAEPTAADEKFDKLVTLLLAQAQTAQPLSPDILRDILTQSATASAVSMQKALRPENETHPGISAYSHPDGDRDHPKPPLPYELYWNNYPVHKFPETETWREWELQGQLKPGKFTVLRKDGSRMTVELRAEYDADGKVEKLFIEHPITREEKWLVPPKIVLLHQLIDPSNLKQAFMLGTNEQLALMMGGR